MIENLNFECQKEWKHIRKLASDPKELKISQTDNWLRLEADGYSKFVELDLDRIDISELRVCISYLRFINRF